MPPLNGQSTDPATPGVLGENTNGEGVRGISHDAHGGVVGVNDFAGTGAPGTGGQGGYFTSLQGEGVHGESANASHGGVVGVNTSTGVGIYGTSAGGAAIWGVSPKGEGLHVETGSDTYAAATCIQLNPVGTGAGLYAESRGKGPAGDFSGDVRVTGNVLVDKDVKVTGDIQLVGGNDCAECFDASYAASPGTVMIFETGGTLATAKTAYDSCVAGVVSGTGEYKPGIILGKFSEDQEGVHLALIGRVRCKVDASYGPIKIGDLITSSETPGHGMVAKDRHRAFGTTIGKAMTSLDQGQGEVTLLISLQ